ncbi:MAG: hypothetical protein COU07_01855 [Candidatus Harrisonbacteria bacterium CG10_big_fil_rev_8_21_14_0_10_40_38]|uniref:PLD phosphodiesterase domain-containing protein n=1 Tax=Candidatus Harrisonbacteria bacterium CG10_big_fil_rev_8_21_14_0_10_40_38 TaxID=1974583 RepID=A0A2H0UT99_9BACT|nr:MAG: hypothetical protein COU07_01855 [Candidatus Harrisonbacteria bacterium CG10_big_fil_rev_8_21_14_0_10_40_38]
MKKYKFYTKTSEAWRGMHEAIVNAKESILLESFILINDKKTRYIFDALEKKAKEGLKVVVIADAVGSFTLGSSIRKPLEKAGAEVLSFRRWLYRNHRKVLVIDKSIAFIGGVNFSGKYSEWFDLHLKTNKKTLIRYTLRSFAKVYSLAGGKDKEILALKEGKEIKPRSEKTKQWFIDHWPIRGTRALKDYYEKSCKEAKESITIVTPYFIPHRWLIKSLRAAKKRKIKIEVILPERTDSWFTTVANFAFASELENEIEFFFVSEMNHAKIFLVDKKEGLIGSNNIDAQSFDFNLEVSIHVERKDMVHDLYRIIENWKINSKSLKKAYSSLPIYYKAIRPIIKLFQPIL